MQFNFGAGFTGAGQLWFTTRAREGLPPRRRDAEEDFKKGRRKVRRRLAIPEAERRGGSGHRVGTASRSVNSKPAGDQGSPAKRSDLLCVSASPR